MLAGCLLEAADDKCHPEIRLHRLNGCALPCAPKCDSCAMGDGDIGSAVESIQSFYETRMAGFNICWTVLSLQRVL
jgi:hypothetical protein